MARNPEVAIAGSAGDAREQRPAPMSRRDALPRPNARRCATATGRARQGGWVGMIVLLLALVIVAWLSKDALHNYGLLPNVETTMKRAGVPGESAATPGERTGSAAAGAVERMDPTTVTPAPTSAIDKARSVEGMLKQSEGARSGGY